MSKPINKQSVAPAGNLKLGKRSTNMSRAVSHGASLLARPTEASVALSSGSIMAKGSKKKELSFKQQLLMKTLRDSVMRPNGVLALHVKHGHFHDIDSGGTCAVCTYTLQCSICEMIKNEARCYSGTF